MKKIIIFLLFSLLIFSGCDKNIENSVERNDEGIDEGISEKKEVIDTVAENKPKTISLVNAVYQKPKDNQKLIELSNTNIVYNAWSRDGLSFSFKNYKEDNCAFGCDYDLYEYIIKQKEYKVIEKLDQSSKYQVISPDGKWIAFYNDKDWDQNGRQASVKKAKTKNQSEIKNLGKTYFVETARGDSENYFYWSPDSSKLFFKDSFLVFSVDPVEELYNPNRRKGKYVGGGNPWHWSPDSKKIMSIDLISSGGVGIGKDKIDFYIMNFDGTNKQTILIVEGTINDDLLEIDATWAPDSKRIVYSYNLGLYIFDIEKKTTVKITEESAEYSNPHWSPDGENIIYELEKQIWMISL